MTFRDLRLRVRALVAPRRVEAELNEELAFHIEREVQKLVQDGMPPAEARVRARAKFGSVALAADQCRDARGVGFVETTVRDVLYALRTFRHAPLASATIVATVAVGLGLVAAVFTLFSGFMYHADAVRNPDELFTIKRIPRAGARVWMPFTRPQYEDMRAQTTVFTDVIAGWRGFETRVAGRTMNGALVTGNYFQMLGTQAALGRTLVPADDERGGGQSVIVVSHRSWTRDFAGDPAIVGRILSINGFPYEIIGVMPDGFRGLAIGPPDYWGPLSRRGHFSRSSAGKEDTLTVDVVGRLKPGVSPEQAAAGLAAWGAGYFPPDRNMPGPPAFGLTPRDGTVANDAKAILMVFVPRFFAFGLILLIGCANVANLLLARGVSRQREIGIRLSIGASRRRIVRQLMTESLLLSLIAAAGAFAISRFVLETTLQIVVTTVPPEIAENLNLVIPRADWRVVLFILSGAVLSTVLFGLLPALQATRLELVRTMRGELTKDARPGRARGALIAVQVIASALLLIGAAVFLRSAMAQSKVDVGIRTADTIIVDVANEPLRGAVIQALRAEPLVAGIAGSQTQPLGLQRGGFLDVVGETSPRQIPVGLKSVSPEYFDVLDIALLQGRTFTAGERNEDAAVVMVSETAARELSPNGSALGQTVRLTRIDNSKPRTYTVIGVVRDVPGPRMAKWTLKALYLPTSIDTDDTPLTVRVHGDPNQARDVLLDKLTAIDPAISGISTLRVTARIEIYMLGLLFWIALVLGALALVLTVSGLFSVLSYIVEQRTKEIGVRMALGASADNVTRLMLAQLVRPVGVGLVVGAALAVVVARIMLATPLASMIADVVHIFDPVAYVASLACIVLTCALAAAIPARRAARIDPMTVLRQD